MAMANKFAIFCTQYLLIVLAAVTSSASHPKQPPPLPIPPIPNAHQISWQLSELALFFHFGMNTFTDSEWGTGHAHPSLFNPTELNATQWVSVAKSTGFSRVILTVKHHDGFCLWPSDYTDYSVKSSSWKNGSGDVVGELSEAAKAAGLEMGIYLSPWDRHEPCYGKTFEYNEYYLGQMAELLTRYGEIREVFLDNAKGAGEKDMEYFYEWYDFIHQHQPRTIIFSDGGPDTRWIGNEFGIADPTCWSLFNHTSPKVGIDYQYSEQGDPDGKDWMPPECDVSIRHGWFWHASEAPKSALTLLELYYKSVGRNCLLLLNVPPNSSGLISEEDIKVLEEFKEIRTSIFSHNLAEGALPSASSTRRNSSDSNYAAQNVLEESIYSYWAPEDAHSNCTLYLDFQDNVTINVLLVQEPIQMGQRIVAFHLDFLNAAGKWKTATNGTTVGYKRLLRFPTISARHLRLIVDKSRAIPLISYIGVYMDRFSIPGRDDSFNSSGAGAYLKQITRGNSSSYNIYSSI